MTLLGGSWVVLSRVLNPLMSVLNHLIYGSKSPNAVL